ncbi:unnamed protein product, partial [Polarella glacialis]
FRRASSSHYGEPCPPPPPNYLEEDSEELDKEGPSCTHFADARGEDEDTTP